ncbi:MAG: phosphotransferase [Clostridiales bacterium]|nr:phosphotransferase [Clostridiales bacterium]
MKRVPVNTDDLIFPEELKALCEGADIYDSSCSREAEAGLSRLKSDVLIHGDYCLPNIILDGWSFSGFIDTGNGGMGDRHIDVLWGIWTLKFNLGTAKYTDRFIDAYGRDRIDPCLLRRVAAMEMIGG